MSEPTLFVIAGCNGSGKSTYSKSLLPSHVVSFDADNVKKKIYDGFSFDFELRELMSWNKTHELFEESIKDAIANRKDFAYETNFNHDPLHWVNHFKLAGFNIALIYFCLKTADLAVERVAIRFQNGGHYVPDQEVKQRYSDGFNYLDKCYDQFDSIVILESSAENQKPLTLFSYGKGTMPKIKNKLPGYFMDQCSRLSEFINKSELNAL